MKKKALLIGLPLLLLLGGGGTVALSILGVVHVPFLPFGKKRPPLPKDDGKGGPFAPYLAAADSWMARAEKEADRLAAAAPKKPVAPPVDTGPGEAKLAKLWAELPPDKLAAIVAKWPEAQLGRILARMDGDATTELLGTLPPDRAMRLSQAVAAATDAASANVRTDG